MLTKGEIRDLYRKRAGNYNFEILLYRLIGFRENLYREDAVSALSLSQGDTVVDIGCGTGLNFPFLEKAVGPAGKIIGVDLTDQMLEKAKERVGREGWSNVELVQADATSYDFPPGVRGALSTLAITLIPEYDTVIRRAAGALAVGGRLAILDFKEPNWPRWLVRLAAWLNSPYGVSLDIASRHPWESVRRHLKEVEFKEYYFGAMYLSVGEATGRSKNRAEPQPHGL